MIYHKFAYIISVFINYFRHIIRLNDPSNKTILLKPLRSTRITRFLHYYKLVGLLAILPYRSSFVWILFLYLLRGNREISPVPLSYCVCSPSSRTPGEFLTSCITMFEMLLASYSTESASPARFISRLYHFMLSHSSSHTLCPTLNPGVAASDPRTRYRVLATRFPWPACLRLYI